MVQVSISTNTARKTVTVPVTATVSEVLDEANVTIGNSALHLDGAILGRDEYEYSLEDLGVIDEETCTLTAIIKADSAQTV